MNDLIKCLNILPACGLTGFMGHNFFFKYTEDKLSSNANMTSCKKNTLILKKSI